MTAKKARSDVSVEPDLACGKCGPIAQSIESERLVPLKRKSMKVAEKFLTSGFSRPDATLRSVASGLEKPLLERVFLIIIIIMAFI